MKHFLPLMSWVEAREAAEAKAPAILPIGTVDANGTAVPMGLDYLVSEALARHAAERTGGVHLPPITYGVSDAMTAYAGTIDVHPDLLEEQVESVIQSLVTGGFDHILLITNHGPNQAPVEQVCRRIRQRGGVLVPFINPAVLATDLRGDLFAPAEIGHGAEPGVSLMMHLHPGSVSPERMVVAERQKWQGLEILHPWEVKFQNSKVNIFLDLEEVSPSSGWSDPRNASAEKGRILFERMVDFVVAFIERFKTMDTHARPPAIG